MADVRDQPHAQAIGYGSHRLGTQREALAEYTEKARVDWDHPCTLPKPSRAGVGAWTGARRAPYPPIFRPFTANTRQHVVGRRRFTAMGHYGYDASVVESKPVPPLIPAGSRLANEGCPEVLRHVPSLRPGPGHYLFDVTRG